MNAIQRFLGRFAPRAETSTLRSPASWFMEAFGQREAASGVKASEAVAMGLSPYYCGLTMIAGTLGSLPLNVYKTDGKMREVWAQHPAHYLLHTEPNPEMSSMSFRQTMVMQAISRGNAYAEITWDARGNPQGLWLIPPTLCTPRRDDTGQLWYEVRPWDKEVRYLKPEDMLHIPNLGNDGIMGYGLIQLACESIGLNAAQDQYAGKFFRNGGNISGVIETDKVLNDGQFSRLKSEVAQKLSGLSNAHRIAILENGMKFKPMNPTHEEAQLIESRRFTVEEWARWLNLPPHKLKEMTHATFSNVEEQNIEWIIDCLRMWAVRFEHEYNRKLFRKQSIFYTKHVLDGMLRGNLASRFSAYAIARNWGWMSANDVLELEDRNPLPGKLGDMYLVPLNMTPAEKAGEDKPAAPGKPIESDPKQAESLHRRVAAERVVIFGERGDRTAVAAKACEWMGCSEKTADDFVTLSLHLDLLADDAGMSSSELRARKVDALVSLVIGEKNAETT